jgi:membrane-associated protease RseP (regulator of RpoE activity)
VHGGLFAAAFVTTTLAGVAWLLKNPLELTNFPSGLPYSVLLLLMLGTHEFGHYFAARRHGVDVTLPYFLPFPSIAELSLLNPFGTLGAVIRLRSGLHSRRVLFDIGSAGPLAGFAVSLIILVIGFTTLPPREYLYTIHPEYAQLASIPTGGWTFGSTLIYEGVAAVFAPAGAFVPPMNEIYHYPFLCVGWFGLLVTAINLIPVGQLDGGHIIYAMFGTGYHRIAQTALIVLSVLGLSGFLPLLGVPFPYGYPGWLFWAFLLIFFSRVLKLNRPPLIDETPLDSRRTALGWLCILIFIGSFSLVPFSFPG